MSVLVAGRCGTEDNETRESSCGRPGQARRYQDIVSPTRDSCSGLQMFNWARDDDMMLNKRSLQLPPLEI